MIALLALALAQDAPEPEKRQWGGIVLPLVGANSIDGFGMGLGGEVFRKPRVESGDTYDLKITASSYVTVNGRYQSHFFQVETRAQTDWLVQTGFARWTNLMYAGVGGEDVLLARDPAVEGGNRMIAPFGMVAATIPVGDVNVFAQAFTRVARLDPAPGGLLDQRDPFGSRGGFFGDVAGGVHKDTTDRWPLPTSGWVGEASVRVGVGVAGGEVRPVGGPHLEWAGWHGVGRHLTFGVRGQLSRTFGQQPVFVQELLPGRWRDEAGFEQPLTGYARTRPRGDGLASTLFEVRPFVGRAQAGFFDLALHASFFAEAAWLFDGNDPGPFMPSVGFAPVLLWQDATILRPFLSWGWRADVPEGPRRPVFQFGLSLKDPL